MDKKYLPSGHLHPITIFLRKAIKVFENLGFEVVEGPEVETEYYNFDALLIPKNHPARDLQATFWLKDGRLLRTHTSPMQIRAMEKRQPPVRLIVPGRCFRHEATDASHETTFYQLEGLAVDKKISLSDLIGVLEHTILQIYGKDAQTRVRPGYFPFVEPAIEMDVLINQKLNLKNQKWQEVIGAGMIHPGVLKNMGVDASKWSGFAFGMGIDRLMMLYFGVNDIRLSYSGDLRFLKQF